MDNAQVLVTGTGGGVGQSILKALRLANRRYDRGYRIHTTDMNSKSVGLYRGDIGRTVPGADDTEYIPILLQYCKEHDVDIVVPGSDPELPILARNKSQFEENGIAIHVGDPDATAVGTDKWKTVSLLREAGLPYPDSCLPAETSINDICVDLDFPLIVKARHGSGSNDLYIATDRNELNVFVNRVDNPIVQEVVGNEDSEYTVGVIVGNNGTVANAIVMKRQLKNGSTFQARIDEYPSIRETAIEVAETTGLTGSMNIQLRQTPEGPTTFEINPRFSGTTAARAEVGFNGVDAVVQERVFNTDIDQTMLAYDTPAVMLRYLNEFFIDSETVDGFQQELPAGPYGRTSDVI